MSQVSTDLLAAADYIEQYGLYQDGGYWEVDGGQWPAACAVGAIVLTVPADMYERASRVAEARLRLCEYLDVSSLFSWSDNAASKEVVIHAMREAAAK